MSGIAGFLDFGEEWRGKNKHDVLLRMIKVLEHRGPDMSGTYEKDPCHLAHCRLSIIDLSKAGRQPVTNSKGTITMIYAGTTYNYKELRNRYHLDEKGYVFNSSSDAEVLLHLYEELGINFLKQLNGIFSLAIWDTRSRTLYCARDPYGFAPLFYLHQGKSFWFGSEIKAVLQSPFYTPQPDLEALYHFFGYDYVPGTLTPFQGIRELPPGRVLAIGMDKREPVLTRFFDIAYDIDKRISEKEAIARSRDLMIQAVKRQLAADVKVGVMLSGGMDSSTLSALCAKIRGDSDFHTFALSFDDVSFDESPYSQLVSRVLGTRHHEIKVTAEKVKALLPKHLVYIDEPYADGAAIPTYLLAETAKDFVSVLLSGEGGDEFFAGYTLYSAYKIRRLYRALVPGFIRKGIIRPLVHKLPVSYDKLSFDFKAKRFTHGCELSVPHSHYKWREVLSKEARLEVFASPERFSGFPESQQFFIDTFESANAKDTLNKLMYVEFNNQLPNDLMIKNERMTMAHSIEARVPFTDNDLVRFLSTMPVHYKMKGMRKKHLMRSAMKGLLPKEIIEKKKVGMEMPYSKWFCSELRDFTDGIISEKRLNDTGLFNGKEVRRLWDEHQTMKVDHGRFFWGLLSYMLWHEAYIEKRNFADYLSPPRKPRVKNV
ncbi:MAG: asparagine synthase (glutamine-hydrolyzing) [Spirochaetales bacterium]|nr:asparagine synthase (glutamine-hydrolyzing) [Spirochaetales bacterium]